VAAIDRTNHPGKTFSGLIRGFGLKSGAMACSAAWDTTDIIVVGTNDADMAGAVNRIHALQGGAVVFEKGEILVELPLPVFGIMSDRPIEEIARRLKHIRKTAAGLGVRHPDPLLTLITLTGAAIPYLRICEEGLVNLKDGKTLPLLIEF
jgi:adenine deaminase